MADHHFISRAGEAADHKALFHVRWEERVSPRPEIATTAGGP